MRKQHQNPSHVASSNRGTCLEYIVDHWPSLPPHVREAILTLVDGALAVDRIGEGEGNQSESQRSGVRS